MTLVTGSVSGSRSYDYGTSVTLVDQPGSPWLDSRCTCPVSRLCKHAVALVVAAREGRRRPGRRRGPSGSASSTRCSTSSPTPRGSGPPPRATWGSRSGLVPTTAASRGAGGRTARRAGAERRAASPERRRRAGAGTAAGPAGAAQPQGHLGAHARLVDRGAAPGVARRRRRGAGPGPDPAAGRPPGHQPADLGRGGAPAGPRFLRARRCGRCWRRALATGVVLVPGKDLRSVRLAERPARVDARRQRQAGEDADRPRLRPGGRPSRTGGTPVTASRCWPRWPAPPGSRRRPATGWRSGTASRACGTCCSRRSTARSGPRWRGRSRPATGSPYRADEVERLTSDYLPRLQRHLPVASADASLRVPEAPRPRLGARGALARGRRGGADLDAGATAWAPTTGSTAWPTPGGCGASGRPSRRRSCWPRSSSTRRRPTGSAAGAASTACGPSR